MLKGYFLSSAVAVLLFVGTGCFSKPPAAGGANVNVSVNVNGPVMVGCTKELKICPDGSSVGRVPPSCEFTPCPADKPPGAACTMEAKLCPDGSSVGRVPPSCEFAPCPGQVPACKNQCGNGQCQEIVCEAVGCPCSETAASCPQDCK